jgi:hypothetical protein
MAEQTGIWYVWLIVQPWTTHVQSFGGVAAGREFDPFPLAMMD